MTDKEKGKIEMIAYKGFNKDMTCRGFQYEEGKEYEHDGDIELCESGFHACEYPLDCFRYYAPNKSVYHQVELHGDMEAHHDDSKIVASNIKIGAELDIAGLVKASIEYTKERSVPEEGSCATGYCGASSATGEYGASSATGYYGASSATGDCGASSATGNCGASSATGNCGASSVTGDYGASCATGDCGASSATGDCGASSATGNCGASSATGNCGASSVTGDYGASCATGDCGASSATGDCGASSATGNYGSSYAGNETAIAVAWGFHGKAKGVLGAHIVLADWEGDENDSDTWELKGARLFKVDGEMVKADTWYTLRDGELVETE